MVRIVFVCLGNICRSPTAEGVMQHLIEQAGLADHIELDSAGTGAYHVGEQADARSRATARNRGLRLTSISRQVTRGDFDRFDYVVAMDQSNYDDLMSLASDDAQRSKVHMFRAFDPASADDDGVPDPYYGGPRGFDDVFDICDAAAKGMLDYLRQHHDLPA